MESGHSTPHASQWAAGDRANAISANEASLQRRGGALKLCRTASLGQIGGRAAEVRLPPPLPPPPLAVVERDSAAGTHVMMS